MSYREELPFTIATGDTESDTIRLQNDSTPVAIVFPVAPTGATVTFEELIAEAWHPVCNDDGTPYEVTTAAGYIPLKLANTNGMFRFRVVSASAEAADVEGYIISRRV